MYECTVILHIIFIKIVVGNSDIINVNNYQPGIWLPASKDLENKADDLRDELCELMTRMGLDCGEPPIHDMRTFFMNTENVRKSNRLYDLFALNFLNTGVVGCLKDAVTAILSMSLSGATESVKCVFKPLTDLVETSLKMTLDSVKLVRHVHFQTKDCLTRRPTLAKGKCLIALHAKSVMQITQALVKLLKSVTKAVIFISGGIATKLAKCSMAESSNALKDMTRAAAKFGKCVFCVFTRICK